MLYWFPYYSLVGYLIYSRLGKLVVQSLCAAEQYVSSLCSFSNESDNEDKLDEIDTSILKSLRVFQKKMISEEVRKLVEEKIHDKLMLNGLKEDNVICKKQLRGLERQVLALTELVPFEGRADQATVASGNEKKHETNAEALRKVQAHGRQDTKQALLEARREFNERRQNGNGSVPATELVAFEGRADQATVASGNEKKHETNAEALRKVQAHGRQDTKQALLEARREFNERLKDGENGGDERGGNSVVAVTMFDMFGRVDRPTKSSTANAIKPRLPGATDTNRPTTALAAAAASSSAIGVGGAGIASAAHPLDMPTGEALSKVQSHGRRETRAELSNAKATFEARMAKSGTRVTEPDSLFEDQRRFHRHTKSSGGRVR